MSHLIFPLSRPSERYHSDLWRSLFWQAVRELIFRHLELKTLWICVSVHKAGSQNPLILKRGCYLITHTGVLMCSWEFFLVLIHWTRMALVLHRSRVTPTGGQISAIHDLWKIYNLLGWDPGPKQAQNTSQNNLGWRSLSPAVNHALSNPPLTQVPHSQGF